MFTFGAVSKTGPKEEIMQNSRMTLTLIGHGLTSVKPYTSDLKEMSHRVNNTRKTIIKVNYFKFCTSSLYVLSLSMNE